MAPTGIHGEALGTAAVGVVGTKGMKGFVVRAGSTGRGLNCGAGESTWDAFQLSSVLICLRLQKLSLSFLLGLWLYSSVE